MYPGSCDVGITEVGVASLIVKSNQYLAIVNVRIRTHVRGIF
jgi:hypothetical protein